MEIKLGILRVLLLRCVMLRTLLENLNFSSLRPVEERRIISQLKCQRLTIQLLLVEYLYQGFFLGTVDHYTFYFYSKQDVFVGFATVPGFVSLTSTEGSPYLQEIMNEMYSRIFCLLRPWPPNYQTITVQLTWQIFICWSRETWLP